MKHLNDKMPRITAIILIIQILYSSKSKTSTDARVIKEREHFQNVTVADYGDNTFNSTKLLSGEYINTKLKENSSIVYNNEDRELKIFTADHINDRLLNDQNVEHINLSQYTQNEVTTVSHISHTSTTINVDSEIIKTPNFVTGETTGDPNQTTIINEWKMHENNQTQSITPRQQIISKNIEKVNETLLDNQSIPSTTITLTLPNSTDISKDSIRLKKEDDVVVNDSLYKHFLEKTQTNTRNANNEKNDEWKQTLINVMNSTKIKNSYIMDTTASTPLITTENYANFQITKENIYFVPNQSASSITDMPTLSKSNDINKGEIKLKKYDDNLVNDSLSTQILEVQNITKNVINEGNNEWKETMINIMNFTKDVTKIRNTYIINTTTSPQLSSTEDYTDFVSTTENNNKKIMLKETTDSTDLSIHHSNETTEILKYKDTNVEQKDKLVKVNNLAKTAMTYEITTESSTIKMEPITEFLFDTNGSTSFGTDIISTIMPSYVVMYPKNSVNLTKISPNKNNINNTMVNLNKNVTEVELNGTDNKIVIDENINFSANNSESTAKFNVASNDSGGFNSIIELKTTDIPLSEKSTIPTYTNEIQSNVKIRNETVKLAKVNNYKITDMIESMIPTTPVATMNVSSSDVKTNIQLNANIPISQTINNTKWKTSLNTSANMELTTTVRSIKKTADKLLLSSKTSQITEESVSRKTIEATIVSDNNTKEAKNTILITTEGQTGLGTQLKEANNLDVINNDNLSTIIGSANESYNTVTSHPKLQSIEDEIHFTTIKSQNMVNSSKSYTGISIDTNEIESANSGLFFIETTTTKQEHLKDENDLSLNRNQSFVNALPLPSSTVLPNTKFITTPTIHLSTTITLGNNESEEINTNATERPLFSLLNTTLIATTSETIHLSTAIESDKTEFVKFTTTEFVSKELAVTLGTPTISNTTKNMFYSTLMGINGKESQNNILEDSGNDGDNPAEKTEIDVNVIIAIVVSVTGLIALFLLVAFFYLMRKRQKQTSYGQRCRPVSLDAYSLDNVSVIGSVRRKGGPRNSKRSYSNAAFEDPSIRHNILSINELIKFVEKRTFIHEEFRSIPQIIARTDEVQIGCEDKNRYSNVVPLPETRVVLQQINGDTSTEYINANYVRGPKDTTNYYIACQAPLTNTVSDFWRMIWEQNSYVIIQATALIENGVEKCAEYLPPSATLDNHNTYGDFQVTLKNREVKDRYAISTVLLKHALKNESRLLTHYWYKWPEMGVPTEETPIIAMLLEARSSLKSNTFEQIAKYEKTASVETANETTTISNRNAMQNNEQTQLSSEVNENIIMEKLKSNKNQGSLVVHCSPGTGRTGTIIACDIAIRCLETHKRSVNIPHIVYYVRRCRASAVQTKDQYEFIYKVVSTYATKITNAANDS